MARAGDVADGDLILAAVSLQGADYYNEPWAAHRLALEAREHCMAVHMGRVNSRRRRLHTAQAFGCASADGTYLAFGPDTSLPRHLAWMNELHTTPPLFGDDA
ncbi:hypothetical protein [Streptomyces crystallinus]|uniref:Uncharacterized protein n=1 Tax=Streptomyces crystallinus TaxID=68191 RepID=A0ABP3RIL8_9ACTN